jgi:hypothetical protein
MTAKQPAKPVPKKKPVKKLPAQKRPVGRPSKYSEALAARICEMISSGSSLRTVAKTEGMPMVATMFSWMRLHPEFLKQYERAKEEQADALAEDMLDIADDGTNDWMETHDKEGNSVGYKLNGEHVQRSRLRIETRKWIAERMKPKKYGAKVDVAHGVTDPMAALLSRMAGGQTALTPVANPDDKEG